MFFPDMAIMGHLIQQQVDAALCTIIDILDEDIDGAMSQDAAETYSGSQTYYVTIYI